MARTPTIGEKNRLFIEAQQLFFAASASAESRINVSPRSTDLFRVLDDTTVAYLDLTGSGNETAAHLLADGRLTFMFCAFDGKPKILRLYGRGRTAHRGSDEYNALLENFAIDEPTGARQFQILEVELVQTSCGFGVPLFDYVGERDELGAWGEAKGRGGVEEYQQQKNLESMDGLPTGLA